MFPFTGYDIGLFFNLGHKVIYFMANVPVSTAILYIIPVY